MMLISNRDDQDIPDGSGGMRVVVVVVEGGRKGGREGGHLPYGGPKFNEAEM